MARRHELRPGIERAFERDLALFLWLAEMAERARKLSPTEEEKVEVTEEVPKEEAAALAPEPEPDLGEEFAVPVEELEGFSDTSKTVAD